MLGPEEQCSKGIRFRKKPYPSISSVKIGRLAKSHPPGTLERATHAASQGFELLFLLPVGGTGADGPPKIDEGICVFDGEEGVGGGDPPEEIDGLLESQPNPEKANWHAHAGPTPLALGAAIDCAALSPRLFGRARGHGAA